jgi:hypothetical protein
LRFKAFFRFLVVGLSQRVLLTAFHLPLNNRVNASSKVFMLAGIYPDTIVSLQDFGKRKEP